MFPKDSDEVIDFNGERTLDGMSKFLESHGKLGGAAVEEEEEKADEEDEGADDEASAGKEEL